MEGGRCDVAFATGLLRPGWAGCDAALAAGLAQPAIVRARGVLECESERKSMSVAAGVWWRDVLGGMIRGLGGYCSGGASREASSCGGKGLCLFASVRSVIEYTPLKVNLRVWWWAGQVKSSGTCIVKLDHNIVRSRIDCSYSYII